MNSSNFSFYAIPAAWVLALSPHIYAMQLFKSSTNGAQWDNANPRNFLASFKDKLPQSTFLRIQRAESAQTNGFENLALFSAAIVAGNLARLPLETLNLHAGLYLALRAVYNVLYVSIEDQALSNARTGVFFVSVMTMMSLFVRAGNMMYKMGQM